MSSLRFFNSAPCIIDIDQSSLKAYFESRSLQAPLERSADGRLTSGCKAKLTTDLEAFLKRSPFQPRVRVICAIGARGVSVRKLRLPITKDEERRGLLLLQIESEFPVPPEELAWGFLSVAGGSPQSSVAPQEEVVVAAIRKQAVQDYMEIFAACGANAVFTPAALARASLCPRTPGKSAQLEIGTIYSELVTLENGIPTGLRVLPWGVKDLSRRDEARIAETGLVSSSQAAVQALSGMLSKESVCQKLYLNGAAAGQTELASMLSRNLNIICEPLKPAPPEMGSTAIMALSSAAQDNTPFLRLDAEAEGKHTTAKIVAAARQRWAAAAAILILLSLAFPYAEALVFKPRLARKLAAIKADRGRLPVIDSELDLLRYLKQNQPPYLDALYIVSRAVPPGARFDSISMNRRGDLSVRGSMRDANQIAEFRSKLLDSGLFSNLAVEEQTPSPDRQKLVVRMTALWKPEGTRDVAAKLAANEPEKPKGAGGGPSNGMPPGFPSPGPPMAGPVPISTPTPPLIATPAPGTVSGRASTNAPALSNALVLPAPSNPVQIPPQ